MTTTYRITNRTSGLEMGEYDAATAAEALDKMAQDAGYADFAAACKATDQDEANLLVVEAA